MSIGVPAWERRVAYGLTHHETKAVGAGTVPVRIDGGQSRDAVAGNLLDQLTALDALGDDPAAEAQRGRIREEARRLGIGMVSFNVTFEPILDPAVEALPEAERSCIESVARRTIEGADVRAEEVRRLIEKHPNIENLWNCLYVALMRAGREGEADAVIEETVRLFPEYVFGFTNYVLMLLRHERVDDARAVMETGPRGPLHTISFFAPHREVFHYSEVVTFSAMVAYYLIATQRHEAAFKQLSVCERVAPDHPQTVALRDRLDLIRLMQRMKERTAEVVSASRFRAPPKQRKKRK